MLKKAVPDIRTIPGADKKSFTLCDLQEDRFELSLGNIGLCQPEQILIIGRY